MMAVALLPWALVNYVENASENGLEVDGSREMLISALESNKRQRTYTED
jgi:hypothetical protein